MTTVRAAPRARGLGIQFDGDTGVHNAITDVPGVMVGYCTITKGKDADIIQPSAVQTGVTAILPRGKSAKPSYVFAGLHSFNGHGEMTGSHWITDAGYFIGPICITNTHSVGMAHHAVTKWLIKQYPSFFEKWLRFFLPVVAETYDGVMSDINGQHVHEEHVFEALNTASSGPVAEGNVGGGNGMVTYEFKGGTGTSSRVFAIGDDNFTLGVLVQSNFGTRQDLTIRGVPVGKLMPEGAIRDRIAEMSDGSIIVVIATDAPLTPSQLNRLARRATLGFGRTGTIGYHRSGDIFLAFSTANEPLDLTETSKINTITCLEEACLDDVYQAAVEAVEEAIINAMIAGESSRTVRPPGMMLHAIDHEKLMACMNGAG